MNPSDELVPHPPIVREKLAQSLRETRRLRKLLRLSVELAEERHREKFGDTAPIDGEAVSPCQ
jgi:hypothetical protein